MSNQDKLSILLIEDDDDFVAIISDQLRGEQNSITSCSTLKSAAAQLQEGSFDIVLMDLGLPDSEDAPNMEWIRRVNQNVPIVVVTSMDDEEMSLDLMRRGAQDYLIKGEFNSFILKRTISHAIERQKLSHQLVETEATAQELATHESVISNIGRIVSSTADIGQVMKDFGKEVSRLIPFDRLWIMLHDEDQDVFYERFAIGLSLPGDKKRNTIPTRGSFSESVVASETGLIMSANDVRSRGPLANRVSAFLDSGLQRFINVPLTNRGRSVGVMCLASLDESAYSDEDLALLNKIALQISGPITLAETAEKMKALAHRETSLSELGKAIAKSLALHDVLEAARPFVTKLLPARHIAINIVNQEQGTFTRKYIAGEEIDGYPESDEEDLAGSAVYDVIETDQAKILTEEDLNHPSAKDPIKIAAGSGIQTFLIAPLRIEGHSIGTVAWAEYDSGRFTAKDLLLAETISTQLSGAIANCELHQRTISRAEEQLAIQKLQASNQELEVANEVKSQIISNVSHELRTPLTSMLAFADMLNRDREGRLSDQYKMMVGMIRRTGRQLDLLIGDLLTMSRLQSGDVELIYEPLNLNQLVEETVELIAPITSSKSQSIIVDSSNSDIEIEADRTRLTQVLLNILSNASKYSPEGSELTVSTLSEGEAVTIGIEDQGHGLTPEELQSLFKRFSRLDNDATRSEQGTGLGLSIVKRLVDLHRGSVNVESQPGHGTVFNVTIPNRSDVEIKDWAA